MDRAITKGGLRTTSGGPPAHLGCALLGQHARGVLSFHYAPRTGGAYDSHHRTAGIAGRARRRGGFVAARGARAAAGDASDRLPKRAVATRGGIRSSSVSPRPRPGAARRVMIVSRRRPSSRGRSVL